MPSIVPAIGGKRFRIEAPLGKGAMGAVYRAYDQERRQLVALKTLLAPDAAAIYRFKREFRALANVAHPNLVTLYDLVSSGDDWFFTMELVHGETFLKYVRGATTARAEEPKPVTRVEAAAHAAVQPAADESDDVPTQALSDFDPNEAPTTAGSTEQLVSGLRPHEPVERLPAAFTDALEPADLERLQPALVQLAEAIFELHRLGHLHRDIKPSNVLVTPEGRVVVLDFGVITQLTDRAASGDDAIAGTPAYMAPEQIDSEAEPTQASDWYSFGIMLFEALTGQRPFKGSEETILYAKHTASAPVHLLHKCGGPQHLVELCADLLKRNPKDRPRGTEILHRLKNEQRESVRPSLRPSEPGAIPEVIVGRDTELESLQDAWMRSRAGSAVGVLLHGQSGMGKSALVEKFLAGLEQSGEAVVLAGRCYEQESVPYKALDSLVDAIARLLLEQNDEEVRLLLPRDVMALARAFPVLGRVQAVSQFMASDQSDESNRSELQRRAFAALSELMQKLAARFPLVLYIDDLQWGDVDSATFLVRLLGPAGPPALFIAGYRSEHVDSSPLLQALLSSVASEPDARVRMLELKPLSVPVLERLARSLLEELRADPAPAARIAREVKGSPYFVHELVRYAASQPAGGTSGQETSLASVILARAERLSPEAQRLLRVISVAGWRISVGVAQVAAELGPEERRAFVELKANHFARSTGTREVDIIEPYHDRVREAVTPTLSQEEHRHVHLKIAESLEGTPDQGAEHIFALAHHWFQALPEGREQHVYDVNLRAGRTAAASYAHRQTLTYLEQARQVGEGRGLVLDADTQLLMADTCARIGRPDEALEWYGKALDRSDDGIKRAAIRWGISRVHLGWLETGPAIDVAMDALAELGVRPPESPVLRWLSAFWAFLRGLLSLPRALHGGLPPGREREKQRLVAHLYIHLGLTYYFHLTPKLVLQSTMFMLRASTLLGPSRELVEWYIMGSGAAAVLRRKGWVVSMRDRLKEVADRIADPVAVARSGLYRGIFADMIGEPKLAEPLMEKALEANASLLEPLDYYSGAACLAWNRMMRGHTADGWKTIERTLQVDSAGGQLDAVRGHSYRGYAGPLLAMLGRAEEGRERMESFGEHVHHAGVRWLEAQYLGHYILYQAEAGDVGANFDKNVRSYEALGLNFARLPFTMRHSVVGMAYGHRLQCERATEQSRPQHVKRFERSLKILRKVAKGHPTLEGHLNVLEAYYLNTSGSSDKASGLLRKAHEHALEADNRWVLYEVAMERVRFALSRNNKESAGRYLDHARGIALENGWLARADQCSDKLSGLG